MTINDLETYRRSMIPEPFDQLQVTASRETWDWIKADLLKRRKKLSQSAGDPHTKPSKRSKRQTELARLEATIEAINKAKIINPNYDGE